MYPSLREENELMAQYDKQVIGTSYDFIYTDEEAAITRADAIIFSILETTTANYDTFEYPLKLTMREADRNRHIAFEFRFRAVGDCESATLDYVDTGEDRIFVCVQYYTTYGGPEY